MNILDTIITKTYNVSCEFANINNFKQALLKYGMNGNAENCKTIYEVKQNLLNNLSNFNGDYDELAFIQVLNEDIDKIIFQNSEVCRYNIDEIGLMTTMGKYLKLLEKLDIYATPPKFYVVDAFPEPFANTDWSAFCPDAEDERNYGIPKGIYFLKKHIRPYYSEILLAHEMIHSLCGENNPELFAMGIEEGIAEIIGSLYLAGNVLGINAVSNNFAYTRFNRNANLLWTLYLDHTRQAYLLYRKYGIEILAYMINKGRCEIHDIEKKLFSKEPLVFDFSSKTYLGEAFDNMLEYLLLAFTPNYVVTPLQKILIREAKTGVMIKEICDKVQVPMEIVKEELSKIAFATSLFMLDGDKIGYSNVELYKTSKKDCFIPIIRYYKEM